jgi:hypothetical protein
MSGTADKDQHEHAYFQAIEERFFQLNGTPCLLSPADFQLAHRWQHDGIPLDLVLQVMEMVFAQRKKRGMKGRIASLRYFASAVETAWAEHRV